MSLSQKETATARITCCDGSKSKVSVTREEFNEATQPLLNRTIEFTDAMIAMAREKTGVEKIDEFLLVGGSTYMPQVMEMVNSRYKDTLRVEPKLYEPNHAVSKGAALYGNNKAIRDLYEKVLKDLKEKIPIPRQENSKTRQIRKLQTNFRWHLKRLKLRLTPR